jgi:hypothetical protein
VDEKELRKAKQQATKEKVQEAKILDAIRELEEGKPGRKLSFRQVRNAASMNSEMFGAVVHRLKRQGKVKVGNGKVRTGNGAKRTSRMLYRITSQRQTNIQDAIEST